MRKMIVALSAFGVLVGAGIVAAPQAAYAYPTCEQEVRIRCSGYDVGGHGRLDVYYDSYDECVTRETQLRCGHDPDPYASLGKELRDAIDRRAHPVVSVG